jgi:transcriptional regulator with XRE-family HTH domain
MVWCIGRGSPIVAAAMRANFPVRQRVANTVKQLRTAHGLSQDQLAERVGNTGRHISLVESGKVNVGVDILASIATEFAVDVTDLFGESSSATADSLCLIARKDLDRMERIVVRAKRRRAGRGRRGKT